MYIPFSPPDMTLAEAELVKQTILSGWITSGPKKVEFENKLSKYCGTNKTCAMSSATAALELTLRLLEVGPGDEVIDPAYTYIATAMAVIAAGAVPIIAEIDETLMLDPKDVEKKITPKTKAVIPVHMMGYPCDMDRIMAIAKKHNLLVLEDACQGNGGKYKGKRLGSIGDAGALSFNYFKIIYANILTRFPF
jgi:dTDP-4-amino-4,6-dideoxygalactose transaminase